jgi:hypothetical protein
MAQDLFPGGQPLLRFYGPAVSPLRISAHTLDRIVLPGVFAGHFARPIRNLVNQIVDDMGE